MPKATLLDSILGRPSQSYAWSAGDEARVGSSPRAPSEVGSASQPGSVWRSPSTRGYSAPRSATARSRRTRPPSMSDAHTLMPDMNTVNPFSRWWEERSQADQSLSARASEKPSVASPERGPRPPPVAHDTQEWQAWLRSFEQRRAEPSTNNASPPSQFYVPLTQDDSMPDMSEIGYALTQDMPDKGASSLRALREDEWQSSVRQSTPPALASPAEVLGRASPATRSARNELPARRPTRLRQPTRGTRPGDAFEALPDEELARLSWNALYLADGGLVDTSPTKAAAPESPIQTERATSSLERAPPIQPSAPHRTTPEPWTLRMLDGPPQQAPSSQLASPSQLAPSLQLAPSADLREPRIDLGLAHRRRVEGLLRPLQEHRLSALSVSESVQEELSPDVAPWTANTSVLGHLERSELHGTAEAAPRTPRQPREPSLPRTPSASASTATTPSHTRRILDRPRHRGPRPTVLGGIQIAHGTLPAPTHTPRRTVSDQGTPRPAPPAPPLPSLRHVSDTRATDAVQEVPSPQPSIQPTAPPPLAVASPYALGAAELTRPAEGLSLPTSPAPAVAPPVLAAVANPTYLYGSESEREEPVSMHQVYDADSVSPPREEAPPLPAPALPYLMTRPPQSSVPWNSSPATAPAPAPAPAPAQAPAPAPAPARPPAQAPLSAVGPPAQAPLSPARPPAQAPLSYVRSPAQATYSSTGPPAQATYSSTGPPAQATYSSTGPPSQATYSSTGPPAQAPLSPARPSAPAPYSSTGPPSQATYSSTGPPAQAPLSPARPSAPAPYSSTGPPAQAPLSPARPSAPAPYSSTGPPAQAPLSPARPPAQAPLSPVGPPSQAPRSPVGPPAQAPLSHARLPVHYGPNGMPPGRPYAPPHPPAPASMYGYRGPAPMAPTPAPSGTMRPLLPTSPSVYGANQLSPMYASASPVYGTAPMSPMYAPVSPNAWSQVPPTQGWLRAPRVHMANGHTLAPPRAELVMAPSERDPMRAMRRVSSTPDVTRLRSGPFSDPGSMPPGRDGRPFLSPDMARRPRTAADSDAVSLTTNARAPSPLSRPEPSLAASTSVLSMSTAAAMKKAPLGASTNQYLSLSTESGAVPNDSGSTRSPPSSSGRAGGLHARLRPADDLMRTRPTMMGVQVTGSGIRPGDITVVSNMASPRKVGSTQVIVQVIAVAIDRVDRALVVEKLQSDSGTILVPGRSFCGRVVEMGWDVKKLRMGDMVFGLQDLKKGGALAEFLCVDQDLVARAPEGRLSAEQICALPSTGLMVHQIIQNHCVTLPRGARVLILQAHDNLGLLSMQEASRLGLVIVAQVPTQDADTVSMCRANGAAEVITGDPLWAINMLHESSFQLVIDTLGGRAIYDACRRILANHGQFVTCFGDGHSLPNPTHRSHLRSLRRSFFRKDRKVLGYEWIGIDAGADHRSALEAIKVAAQRGALSPRIQSVLPLDDAARALRSHDEGVVVVRVS